MSAKKQDLDPVARAQALAERSIEKARRLQSKRLELVGHAMVEAAQHKPELREVISRALQDLDLAKPDRELVATLLANGS